MAEFVDYFPLVIVHFDGHVVTLLPRAVVGGPVLGHALFRRPGRRGIHGERRTIGD